MKKSKAVSLRDVARRNSEGISQAEQDQINKKLRRLYGKHVDEITLHSRPIANTDRAQWAYSAVCSEHGVVSEWTRDIDKRQRRVIEHLRGAF